MGEVNLGATTTFKLLAVHGSMGEAASEDSTDFSLGQWNCFVCNRSDAKFKARCHLVQGFWVAPLVERS